MDAARRCIFETAPRINGEVSLNSTASQKARFLVRTGGSGWMVYDRELKGPAQLEKGGRFAEKLTKEQAENLRQMLTDSLPLPAGKRRAARSE
ncbi:hypothetical protein CK489_27615 [Bradyrhizobium sp. UFLA03-84]|nr:hypothetical protein CK489_27615 [Bradyrhizobium sp. UFLA03-84]